MYIKKREHEVLGFGTMGEDAFLGNIGEFDHEDNTLIKKLSYVVYVDPETTEELYAHKDKLLTFKELREELIKEYYGVE